MCLSFKFPLYSLPSPYPHIQDTRQNSCVFQIRTLCDYWLLRVVQHLGSCWNPRTVQRISFLSLLTSHRYDAYCLLVNCIDVSLPNCTSFLKGVYVPPFSCWLNNFYAYKNCQKKYLFSIDYTYLQNFCILKCVKQDKSWRVRYMVANQLYELCEAVGPEATRLIIFCFIHLTARYSLYQFTCHGPFHFVYYYKSPSQYKKYILHADIGLCVRYHDMHLLFHFIF